MLKNIQIHILHRYIRMFLLMPINNDALMLLSFSSLLTSIMGMKTKRLTQLTQIFNRLSSQKPISKIFLGE